MSMTFGIRPDRPVEIWHCEACGYEWGHVGGCSSCPYCDSSHVRPVRRLTSTQRVLREIEEQANARE